MRLLLDEDMLARHRTHVVRQGTRTTVTAYRLDIDMPLIVAVLFLLCLGLVEVASASISISDKTFGQPFYYLIRQLMYVVFGVFTALLALRTPIYLIQKYNGWLFILTFASLFALLIPGIGREVNGSVRWLSLGGFGVQPSELMKLAVVLYLAGYLVRRSQEVSASLSGFVRPMVLLVLVAMLLMWQPDFGSAAIIFATALGMMFIGGVCLWQFGLLMLAISGGLGLLAVSAPYRMERLMTFMNPWADPFNSGFQLTQALIAFGRGEITGVGLGGSIQKLFYLPEAHTDFLFAVLAEELGMITAMAVVLVYVFIVWRSYAIGSEAERNDKLYSAYLCYGLGLWIALQTFVNLGVNMGLLPTKGLTLPFMSYGGSSIVVMCLAAGLLLRVDMENRVERRRTL